MSRRVVPEFNGTPTLTDEKIAAFKQWFATAMADEDVATDPSDNAFYEGWATCLHSVLTLLYDNGETTVDNRTAPSSESGGA